MDKDKGFLIFILQVVFFGPLQIMSMEQQESPKSKFLADLEQCYHNQVIAMQALENQKQVIKDVLSLQKDLIMISQSASFMNDFVGNTTNTDEQKLIHILFSSHRYFTLWQEQLVVNFFADQKEKFFKKHTKAEQSRISFLFNQK